MYIDIQTIYMYVCIYTFIYIYILHVNIQTHAHIYRQKEAEREQGRADLMEFSPWICAFFGLSCLYLHIYFLNCVCLCVIYK